MPSFEAQPLAHPIAGDFVPDPFAPSAPTPGPGPESEPEPQIDVERLAAESRESGYALGREEGYEAGRTAGRAELDAEVLGSAARALEEAAGRLHSLRRGALREQRRAVVELALALAERLVGRALAGDPDALAGVVERAVEALPEPGAVAVRLSTADWEALASGGAPRLEQLRAERGLDLAADASLAPGDVRVLGDASEVDARLAELLRRTRAELALLYEIEGEAR